MSIAVDSVYREYSRSPQVRPSARRIALRWVPAVLFLLEGILITEAFFQL